MNTYTIPKPVKHTYRYYNNLNENQVKENISAQQECYHALATFAKDVVKESGKPYTIEFTKSDDNRFAHFLVDGKYKVPIKFEDKYVNIENGGYGGSRTSYTERKQFTKVMFDKPLTFQNHGKKLLNIIESSMSLKDSQEAKQDASSRNENMAKYIHLYLMREDTNLPFKKKFCFRSNENTISITKDKDYSDTTASEFTMLLVFEDPSNIEFNIRLKEIDFTKYAAISFEQFNEKRDNLIASLQQAETDFISLRHQVLNAITLGVKVNFKVSEQ